jgi:hypothetical protein
MNKGRVWEDRGSKETDRCPLTLVVEAGGMVVGAATAGTGFCL